MRISAGVLLFALIALSSAHAQPSGRQFPADMKWLMRLDIRALKGSSTGILLQRAVRGEAERQLSAIHAIGAINLTNDVDTLILYGKSAPQKSGVLYAYGRFHPEKVTALISGFQSFKARTLGKHRLLSWQDQGRRANLCFIDPALAVMAYDPALVVEAASLIDENRPRPQTAFEGALANKEGRFVSCQINDLSVLATEGSPFMMLKQAETLNLEVFQFKGTGGLDCRMAIKTPTAETAQQLNQVALALQTAMMFKTMNDPEMAKLVQNLHISASDRFVNATLAVPETTLRALATAPAAPAKTDLSARRKPRSAPPAPAL